MPNDRKVQIVEVGPRDGLQNEFVMIDGKKQFITLPPETIATYIKMLAKAGLKRIEAGAFVHPDASPSMRGSDKVAELINQYRDAGEITKDVVFSYLAPNKRGLERATTSKADEIAVFVATTDEFTKNNLKLDEVKGAVDKSFAMLEEWLPGYTSQHGHIPVRGYLSTVFGGAYPPPEEVKPERVAELTKRLLDMGCYEVSLGDTTGIATPEKVEAVIEAFINAKPPIELDKIALHFHDTNNLAVANIKRGYKLGVRVFDSATGGVGGCPFAGPGAKGNVATDIAINALPAGSIEYRADLDLLREAENYIKRELSKAKQQTL